MIRILLSAGLLLFHTATQAAIAVGATISSQTDSSNATITDITHTVDTGTEMLVVLVSGWCNSNQGMDTISSANYCVSGATWTKSGETGQAMTTQEAPTQGAWSGIGAQEAVVMYTLNSPNIGAGAVSFGGGSHTTQEGITFIAMNISGVDETVGTNGLRDTESDSQTGSTISANVSSSTNDLVIAVFYTYADAVFNVTTGSTTRFGPTTFNSATASVYTWAGAATSKTVGITSGGTYPAMMVISIGGDAPAGGPSAALLRRRRE